MDLLYSIWGIFFTVYIWSTLILIGYFIWRQFLICSQSSIRIVKLVMATEDEDEDDNEDEDKVD